MKLSVHLKNILISYQKKIGAEVLINNKDIKVLLTESTKPMVSQLQPTYNYSI